MAILTRATLQTELNRLQAEAARIDDAYNAGRATKAEILRSERAMDRIIRKLAALDMEIED